MIRAFIFDLDGTLLDSEVLWVEATHQLLRELGHDLSHDDAMEMVYGRSWHDVYAAIRGRFAGLTMSREAMEVELSRRMRPLRRTRKLGIDGSVSLLKRLARTHPVCIVSGSPRGDLVEALDILGIAGDIAFFLSSEDYAPGKPSPAGFLAAAVRLGVSPGECLVFEDSAAGVAAAKAAGMRCVALARPGAPAQDVSAADLCVADLGDFTPARLDPAGMGA
jgi:HAD superfamily hydrolase (TIGR01509 family)